MKKELITLVAAGSFVAAVAAVGHSFADQATQARASPQAEPGKVDKTQVVPSLLVMSAKGFTYAGGKLVLRGVSPITISFADRPARLAGSVPTESIVADWAEGRDSFEKVPPNADFSSFQGEGVQNAVVELKNPVLAGDSLTYDIRLLKGDLSAQGGPSSLFIDLIGMPFTPMSYAGVARRTVRRTAYWSTRPVYATPVVLAPHVVVY